MKILRLASFAVSLALTTMVAHAATILVPSASEWASWPEYCRAKYAYLRSEVAADFTPKVLPTDILRYESSLGDAWIYIHHHCMSLQYWQRANMALTPREKKYNLDQATYESMFTFVRISKHLPIYAEIATHLGSIARAANDPRSAEHYFELARTSHPDYPGGYQGLALLLEDQHKNEAARDVLLDGNKATDGKSPEIHYFLGLIYLKLSDLDDAVTHAKLAYELGYPLPGLRQKLEAAGQTLN